MPGILRRAWFGVGGAEEIGEGVEGEDEGIGLQPADSQGRVINQGIA